MKLGKRKTKQEKTISREKEKKGKTLFFSKFKSKKAFAGLAAILLLVGGIAVYNSLTSKSATFGWIQTDWSGGNSENTASHETDQTGWSEFANKDANVDVSTAGEISLQNASETQTDTTTEDFEASIQQEVVDFVATGDEMAYKRPPGASCDGDNDCSNNNCVSGRCECTSEDIGKKTSGGILASCDFEGRTLIAQPSDISGGAEWGCYGTSISGADSTTDGAQNTIDILNGCSASGIAARLCAESTLNGFDDWYLPAKDELNVLFQNQDDVGGFSSDGYWSSSESSSGLAWNQYFDNGYQSSTYKNYSRRVRCLRSLQN